MQTLVVCYTVSEAWDLIKDTKPTYQVAPNGFGGHGQDVRDSWAAAGLQYPLTGRRYDKIYVMLDPHYPAALPEGLEEKIINEDLPTHLNIGGVLERVMYAARHVAIG